MYPYIVQHKEIRIVFYSIEVRAHVQFTLDIVRRHDVWKAVF
jgi:hypothetical protein